MFYPDETLPTEHEYEHIHPTTAVLRGGYQADVRRHLTRTMTSDDAAPFIRVKSMLRNRSFKGRRSPVSYDEENHYLLRSCCRDGCSIIDIMGVCN